MGLILVIDDEMNVREFVEQALTTAGHEVIVADNGRDGLRLYRERRPDLVITDIYMPGIDGVDVMLELRNDPSVKVVAISGGGTEGNLTFLDAALPIGASQALAKPFTLQQLREAVAAALAA